MEESNEELRVIPELYFLIAKFLSGGPLKETAKTLLKELERVEVLPRRLDWEGAEHSQSFRELEARYSDVSWDRLAAVCARALRLARELPPAAPPVPALPPPAPLLPPGAPPPPPAPSQARLAPRLSLLSDALVRPKPPYSVYKQDHTLVRRLVSRELGSGAPGAAGGRGGRAAFCPRMLAGLALQRRTLGHLSAVYCLVFDCTGRYVVTGADDLLVKVWSAIDGRLLCTLRGAAAEITDVAVSRDGALLAAGSVERLVRVWCLRTAAPRAVLSAHAGTITSVQWAPGARGGVRWLASTSTDGSVAFWTCSHDGQFLSQPVQYVERMRPGACHMICAAWSAGGGFLAAGSADHHVRVYCLEPAASPPRRVLETAVHGDAVDSIAWAHRGLRFVSGSKDGSAALWTLHATQWRHCMLRCSPLEGAGEGAERERRLKVTMVCWDRSDAYVLTAVSDCTVRVWCSLTCTQVRCLRGHRDEAYVLEAHPFLAGVVLSAGHDGQLFVWDAAQGEVLAKFHNHIEGQGDGALFDAKWGGACSVAASDSHGHLLLLGLGQGHRLLRKLPTELFFHTDYRPLVRDALGGALDEQTETPPHELPPPFLVDVEGAPHAPELQRLVPGRENLARSQLIPAALQQRSRLDLMIEALAGPRTPPGAGGGGGGGGEARGPWRGEGVRHTAGSWQRGEPAPLCTRPIVAPLPPAHREQQERTSAELNAFEQSWYRREMRRRPVMISTAGEGAGGPRRRPGRRPGAPRARAPPRPAPAPPPAAPSPWSSSEEESSGRVSRSEPSERSMRSGRLRSPRVSSGDSDTSLSYSDSKTEESSSSSQYSDWEAGAALAPPARARRRPQPTDRYSPSVVAPKRGERAPSAPAPGPSSAGAPAAPAAPSAPSAPSPPPRELPEAYRPGEWLCAVSPRKAPYHPQMGDHCLYFRLGHQRYFEAVSEKDVYKLGPRDRPWDQGHVYECEAVKVVGIKYVIKPPRVACLRLACELPPPPGAGGGGGGGGAPRGRFLTVRYHDMPDVIDFLVLRQQYEVATARRWGPGDRFRCMIDDSWWTGAVLERSGPAAADPVPDAGDPEAALEWSLAAAAQFLSLRVRWDNGEVERLSPWDLEPVDEARQPAQRGGAVPVLPQELDAVLYRARADEWPPHGDRAAACANIAQHISQVMSLSVAEPFVAPVDLQLYPSYALVVPYPIDLATIRARFENLFYRRLAAAQFDVRYLASNAERFNEAHSPIVRQARLVTDLLLQLMARWSDVDVLAVYHRLAADYRSEDDENAARQPVRARRGSGRGGGAWRDACAAVLRELVASADAEPFRRPVSADQAPDYHVVVPRPMDLGTVSARLSAGQYARPEQLAADVRLVFANSRLYNTNKRSRIYSMTVRLSALFESLWARMVAAPRGRGGAGGGTRGRAHRGDEPSRPARRVRRPLRRARLTVATESMNGVNGGSSSSSDCETLAATSRRVHAGSERDGDGEGAAGGAGGADSWDSDAPLHVHRKGKGVGKKSKGSGGSAGQPGPSGGRARRGGEDEPYVPERNGLASNSESGSETRLLVLEEELQEDVQLTYSEGSGGTQGGGHTSARKRRRVRSSDSAPSRSRRTHRARAKAKRTRERFSLESSSSSSSEGAGSARRYESDHSYHPRYSTDDDAPLHLYRQRQEAAEEAGPSSSRHEGHPRSGGVMLRARSPRLGRYNEDSEEDSAAAISKRLPHHHRAHHLARRLHATRLRHAHQNAGVGSTAHTSDHNYYNGHSAGHSGGHGGGHSGGHSGHNDTDDHNATNGRSPASPPRSAPPPALSISSRGRVRKLTAKARGLLD